MEKLYDRIIWHNGTTPAINETNLNKMSKALDDIDDRIIQIAGAVLVTVPQLQAMLEHTEDIMEQIEELSQNPPYIGANGNWYVWDTSTGEYVDSGVDASITVTIDDVTALAPDAQPYVTNTGTSTDPVFHLFIPRGQPGKGISSIAKTGTSGYVDTYTITYTDNTSTTYTVTNGRNTDQVTTIPTASAALVGTIYQYIGASTSSYTHGFYYECVNDGGIYKWVNIPVGNDPVEITSSDPYTFRQGLGTMADMDIVGGTVAWNQLVQNGDFESTSYWAYPNGTFSVSNNVGTLTADNNLSSSFSLRQLSDAWKNTHKFLVFANIKISVAVRFRMYLSGTYSSYMDIPANTWKTIIKVISATGSDREFGLYPNSTGAMSNGDTLQVSKTNIIDLTLMFGSTIADRAYAMEQATSGSGIAWLKNMGFFTQDYYPYDAGSLKSVEGLQSRDVSRFNQWDEEWESGLYNISNGQKVNNANYIRSKNYLNVLPNTTYYIKTAASENYFVLFDSNKNFISTVTRATSGEFTTPSNARYAGLNVYGTTYNHDICINLSDPAKNGTYEPYHGRSYPLDSSLTLRGIPKLDSNNKLYYDGDIYHADGSVERKYGIVDLGTLTWTHSNVVVSENTLHYFTSQNVQDIKTISEQTSLIGLICAKYKTVIQYEWTDNVPCVFKQVDNQKVIITDNNYTDAATFKEAMSGVMLVYELATPTTETAQPYQNPQRAFSDGTEGFTMTGIVPVGNNTTYQLSKALIPAEDYTDGAVSVVQMDVDGKAGKDMISDAWVSGQAYSVGNYCIYGDMIYRCIQTVTQGTAILPTNTSYWTPTKIATELETLNSRLVEHVIIDTGVQHVTTQQSQYNRLIWQSSNTGIKPSDILDTYKSIRLVLYTGSTSANCTPRGSTTFNCDYFPANTNFAIDTAGYWSTTMCVAQVTTTTAGTNSYNYLIWYDENQASAYMRFVLTGIKR